MILSKYLEIISGDIERVCSMMHKLTSFQLMMKSEGFEEYAADGVYNDGEMADFYMTGRGIVEENHSIAAKFYTVSGAHGSVAALYNLGVLKLNGDGVEANADEALILIRLAAEKGYKPAIEALKGE